MLAKLPADRQALLQAADLIEIHGHCKNLREIEGGALCVLGAISKAVTGDPWRLEGWHDEPCVRIARFVGVDCAATWNNEPSRTAEEVTSALRAAALHGL